MYDEDYEKKVMNLCSELVNADEKNLFDQDRLLEAMKVRAGHLIDADTKV